MLRDYCPIMCGLCRPIRKKTPRIVLEQENNILFPNPSTQPPKSMETTNFLSSHSITQDNPVNSSQISLIKVKTSQNKKPGELFDFPDNMMADTPGIDDDVENVFYSR